MRARGLAAAALLAALPLQGGCAFLRVTKVGPDAASGRGVRFALPKTYLAVTPRGDGSVAVEELSLPDPDATFAAHGVAFFATHSLDLQVEQGLLTLATWNADTSAVVAQGTQTGSGLAAAMLEAETKAEAAAAAETAGAQQAARDAEDALRIAEAAAEANPSRANQAKLAEAQVRLEIAQRNLAELGSARDARDAADGAWGPMFYEVVDVLDPETGERSVALRAADAFPSEGGAASQVRFPVRRPPPAAKVEFFPRGLVSPRALRQGDRPRFQIEASAPFALRPGSILLRDGEEVRLDAHVALSQTSPTEAVVIVLPGAPRGRYRLTLMVDAGPLTEPPEFEFQL